MDVAQQRVNEVRLDVSSDWMRHDSVAFIKSSDHEGFRANVLVNTRPANGMDLKAAAHEARKGILQQGLPGLRFLGENESAIGGQSAVALDFEHSMAVDIEGRKLEADLRRRMVIMVLDDTVYEVTVASHKDAEQDWSDIESVLKTLAPA